MTPALSYERIERAADAVLERNAVLRPPVQIDLLAEREGLRFEYVDLLSVSGAYHREGPRSGVAFISKREHRLRQRFSAAHELAHHVLDDPVTVTALGFPLLTLPSGYRGRGRHWGHEYFAGCLLMPRSWVGEIARHGSWSTQVDFVAEVGRTFDVSRAAAAVRLRELGYGETSR